MRVNNWISFVCIMAAIAIGVAIAALISEVNLIEPGWCRGRANCLREWFGAFSGWVAAAGAVLAAFMTVPHLRRQADEARRQADEARSQTDYLTGRGEPLVDAIQHQHDGNVVVVRVTNWNRSPMILTGISFANDLLQTGLRKVTMMDKERPDAGFKKRQLIGGRFTPPIPMHGWKDRSKGPCEVRIDLTATAGDPEPVQEWAGIVVDVAIASTGTDTKEQKFSVPIAGVSAS